MLRNRALRTLTLAATAVAGLIYWFPVRHWMRRWGATPDELARVMAGDAIIASPTHSQTHAITVNAPPDDIWPWLVQMGYKRGGLYSYDWLDRLFGFLDRPSANRILPEFQHLAVGDKILLGSQELTVTALDPLRALALHQKAHGYEWVWQFGLYPVDHGRTRLVSRGTEHIPNTVGGWLFMRVLEPTGFVMTAQMLLGLKRRAETLHGLIVGEWPALKPTVEPIAERRFDGSRAEELPHDSMEHEGHQVAR